MAISILANHTPKLQFIPKDSSIEISLDASITESHSFNSRVSAFPVEDGLSIVDNIINDPAGLEINGFITNTPITFFLSNIASLINDTSGGDRVKTAFEGLLALRESKEPFTIVTGLKTYEDMVFTNLSFPRDRSVGTTNLRFTARVVNVKFVSSRTVAAKIISEPPALSDQATPTVDVGKQVTTATTGKGSSGLFDVLRNAGVFQ